MHCGRHDTLEPLIIRPLSGATNAQERQRHKCHVIKVRLGSATKRPGFPSKKVQCLQSQRYSSCDVGGVGRYCLVIIIKCKEFNALRAFIFVPKQSATDTQALYMQ